MQKESFSLGDEQGEPSEDESTDFHEKASVAIPRKSLGADVDILNDDFVTSATTNFQKDPGRGAAMAMRLLANLRNEKVERERMHSIIQAHSSNSGPATRRSSILLTEHRHNDTTIPVMPPVNTDSPPLYRASPPSYRASPPTNRATMFLPESAGRGSVSDSPVIVRGSPINHRATMYQPTQSSNLAQRQGSGPSFKQQPPIDLSLFGVETDQMDPTDRLHAAKMRLRPVSSINSDNRKSATDII